MAVYSAPFSAQSVTGVQDLFELTAPATARVQILGVCLGQYSDAGDSQAESLGVRLMRGHTDAGSGGAAVTPANVSGHTGALTALSTVMRNNTTIATGAILDDLALGSDLLTLDDEGLGLATAWDPDLAVCLLATAWNVQASFEWRAPPYLNDVITLDRGQRMVVRLSAPADALSVNGTLIFSEV